MPNRVWIKNGAGTQPHTPTLPNCWQGETNCIIGPFSSKNVAEYFAQANEETRYDSIMKRIFPNGDAWYVEVAALES